MNMKIECFENKIIIYLYKNKLCLDNIDILNKEIKNLFIKLIKICNFDFFGLSKVNIYNNDVYGNIIEIDKIYKSDFNLDIIDLKLIVHKNIDFYLEIDNNLYIDVKEDFYKNDKYYININRFDNLLKYIEYGKIIYKNV